MTYSFFTVENLIVAIPLILATIRSYHQQIRQGKHLGYSLRNIGYGTFATLWLNFFIATYPAIQKVSDLLSPAVHTPADHAEANTILIVVLFGLVMTYALSGFFARKGRAAFYYFEDRYGGEEDGEESS